MEIEIDVRQDSKLDLSGIYESAMETYVATEAASASKVLKGLNVSENVIMAKKNIDLAKKCMSKKKFEDAAKHLNLADKAVDEAIKDCEFFRDRVASTVATDKDRKKAASFEGNRIRRRYNQAGDDYMADAKDDFKYGSKMEGIKKGFKGLGQYARGLRKGISSYVNTRKKGPQAEEGEDQRKVDAEYNYDKSQDYIMSNVQKHMKQLKALKDTIKALRKQVAQAIKFQKNGGNAQTKATATKEAPVDGKKNSAQTANTAKQNNQTQQTKKAQPTQKPVQQNQSKGTQNAQGSQKNTNKNQQAGKNQNNGKASSKVKAANA